MNAKTLEQLLLLEQSGELSPKQYRALEAALVASAEARRLRKNLRGLAAAIPAPAAQPAPDAVTRIAERLRQAPPPAFTFQPAWKPALAAVAALTLLFGVRTFHAPKTAVSSEATLASIPGVEDEWTDPLDAEFIELENLITSISADHSLEITEI
jgi:anti-sigma factor RsiW